MNCRTPKYGTILCLGGIILQTIQAVFIDRDGTIGGTGHFIHPRDFKLFPSSLEALNLLKENGIRIFALTNQHNIAKGLATEFDFTQQFESYGFDASYICPHEPEEGCDCHKTTTWIAIKSCD